MDGTWFELWTYRFYIWLPFLGTIHGAWWAWNLRATSHKIKLKSDRLQNRQFLKHFGVPLIYGNKPAFYGNKHVFYGNKPAFNGLSTVAWGNKKNQKITNFKLVFPKYGMRLWVGIQYLVPVWHHILAKNVHGLSMICPWFVNDLSMIFVHGLSMVCPWFVYDLSMICLWFFVYVLSMICPWFVYDLSMICLWFVYDLSMVCLWFVYGLSMVCLWFVYDLSMVCLCFGTPRLPQIHRTFPTPWDQADSFFQSLCQISHQAEKPSYGIIHRIGAICKRHDLIYCAHCLGRVSKLAKWKSHRPPVKIGL